MIKRRLASACRSTARLGTHPPPGNRRPLTSRAGGRRAHPGAPRRTRRCRPQNDQPDRARGKRPTAQPPSSDRRRARRGPRRPLAVALGPCSTGETGPSVATRLTFGRTAPACPRGTGGRPGPGSGRPHLRRHRNVRFTAPALGTSTRARGSCGAAHVTPQTPRRMARTAAAQHLDRLFPRWRTCTTHDGRPGALAVFLDPAGGRLLVVGHCGSGPRWGHSVREIMLR